MTTMPDVIETLHSSLIPLRGIPADYDPIMELIGNARVVLLGEASHGTQEFYATRAAITERLIRDRQFCAVAVEADWPDAYRVNRYVRWVGNDANASMALDDFKRFPTWMWRNTEVVQFVEWMRAYNSTVPSDAHRVGFYGIDLYSLHASIDAVLRYLNTIDPEAARRARERYACFDHFGEDTQAYGYATAFGMGDSCEQEVITQLVELRRRAAEYATRDGRVARDDYFFAEQNARLVKNAEEYYRSMFRGHVQSWNLRDRHMVETLDALIQFLSRDRPDAKVVVWAHNSHLGDARATEMGARGELNVGQLVRERYGTAATLIGFTTNTGRVTAASDWDAPAENKGVRPALSGSYERLFHETGVPRFYLSLQEPAIRAALADSRLERAIGVIYRPETERTSHYFHASLPAQFDGLLHFDQTTALRPLETTAEWASEEVPETFPTGI
jgi:erythromycin esterase-like protein